MIPLILGTILMTMQGQIGMGPNSPRQAIIAHRGASGLAPEHTLAAYRLALEHGADFVEPDLHLTRDGVLVCLHDDTLERTTDVESVFPDRGRIVAGRRRWPVSDFTLAEIRRLDAGSWKGRQFAGEKIPTFAELIDLVRGKAGLIPELKTPGHARASGQDMEKSVMEVLRTKKLDRPGAEPKSPVVLQSFEADSLKRLRGDHGCKLPLVFLIETDASPDKLKDIKTFADGIGPSKKVVLDRPEIVRDAHTVGLSVTVWTFRASGPGAFPNVTAEMRHFLDDLRVDGIFTDNPEQAPGKRTNDE